MASIEEKVEEHFKAILDAFNIRHYGKTEEINGSITRALRKADSKSGGSGANYPDIQLLLQNKTSRYIPVMIEAKGTKNKLEKLTQDGDIELVSSGKNPNSAIQKFAVNGALHYGLAILDEGTYNEVIIVGINGTTMIDGRVSDPEINIMCLRQTTWLLKKLKNLTSCRLRSPTSMLFIIRSTSCH